MTPAAGTNRWKAIEIPANSRIQIDRDREREERGRVLQVRVFIMISRRLLVTERGSVLPAQSFYND